MRRYLLALDQGTTSSRALLFDEEAQPVAVAQQEFPQIYPRPGWVEHDPDAIWESQFACARQTVSDAGISPRDIAAIGIANQRETTLLWDRKTGEPLHNAIVWQDRRTADHCDRLRSDGLEEAIRERTGLLLDPYFSATKLAWLLANVPGARERAERGELAFGTVDTWLLWRLTGGRIHATDASNASRTLLFDLQTLSWDPFLLDLFDIPPSTLPGVRASSGLFGLSDAQLFGVEIPISGIAGDQQAATFGQMCFEPGMAKNTYGTGCFVLMNTGEARRSSSHRLLSTVAWQMHGVVHYALEGSVFAAGAAIQWLRDELGILRSSAESEALAGSVPNTGGVYLVPAFAGLGAPHWDSGARGAIVGLTRGASKAHLCRAALEAACFQSVEVIRAMEADCGEPLRDLRVDGGMTRNSLLLQMQADLLGIPVHRPAVTETTALGAACLAGMAAGLWPDTHSLARGWRIERTFEPQISDDDRESRMAGWKRAVRRALSAEA